MGNAVVCLGPEEGEEGSGHYGDATWALSGCFVVRLGHWGVCTGFLGFGIR